MQPIELIAQIIGIFGMAANIASYQLKSKKAVLVLQLCGAILFSLNFILLGAITGAIMNSINILLSLVFIFKDKTNANHIAWTIGFIAAYATSYVLTFVLFGTDFNIKSALTEALPLVGTVTTVISYRMKGAKAIRRLGFIRSPAWLVYDALVLSIGGVLCEVFSLISITIGTIRLDSKKK